MTDETQATTPSEQTTTQQQTTATPQAAWYENAAPEVKDFLSSKGGNVDLSPEVALNAFNGWRNAEKMIGVPHDRLLKIPADENDKNGWDSIYNKLGRPESKDKYELDLGDSPDEGFVEWAKENFYDLGISNKAAKELSKRWNEYANSAMSASQEANAGRFNDDVAALKKEWGAAYEHHANVVDRVAMQLELGQETLDALKKEMGPRGAMNFLYKIGAKTGEAEFVSNTGSSGFNGAMTPADAKARISALQRDKDFAAKYISGNVEAKTEMERLHKVAYPEA